MKSGNVSSSSGQKPANRLHVVWAVCFLFAVAGCASAPGSNPRDPWEAYNRSMSGFNDGFDKAILKPAATVYEAVLPSLVRTGIGNFFKNLYEPWVALNAALQLKGQAATDTLVRFGMNTFIGLGGVLDVATEFGIDRSQNDLGQTLGVWGVESGPYFVIPIFGPSTVREALAFAVETRADPINKQSSVSLKDSLYIVRAIDFRASVLRAGALLDEAALDKYTFTRDIYLQRRDNMVLDGREPPQIEEPPAK